MHIEFEHRLPSLNVDGRHNGTYNNRELAVPGVLTANDPRLGLFIKTLRDIIREDRSLIFIDGRRLTVSKNWIRDHVHEMKGFCHWEYDLNSFLDFIIETQRPDGQFYELIKQYDDTHWQFVDEDCRVMYPEDNLTLVRLEIEADIEYLVVEGAERVYRVTGDRKWLWGILPKLEAGIDYITSDPKRWDEEHGLVKRAFTIDTWDFTYGTTDADRRITEKTPMSIMHGDNTGVYAAMKTLARLHRIFGNDAKVAEWERRAEALKKNIFRYLYNGTYFIHQLHLGHAGAEDGLEEKRLSLSNTYALNRGILTDEESRRLIREYMSRREESGYFAEWFTVYPPYENFVKYPAGEYVNGAISPFAAGELAKGAFRCGMEEYGWDILSRFMKMAERDGKIYFLYSPVDCSPQDEMGPSAWGAAGLLSAIDEGLMGIVNAGVGYDTIDFSPCLPVTHYDEIRYFTGYEKTECFVEMKYILKEYGMRYDLTSPARKINAHIYIPRGKLPAEVYVNGTGVPYRISRVGDSLHADLVICPAGRTVSVEVMFCK